MHSIVLNTYCFRHKIQDPISICWQIFYLRKFVILYFQLEKLFKHFKLLQLIALESRIQNTQIEFFFGDLQGFGRAILSSRSLAIKLASTTFREQLLYVMWFFSNFIRLNCHYLDIYAVPLESVFVTLATAH